MCMKKTVASLLSILLALSLCGCWNYRELESITTVTGMAIDKTIDGKWYITAEIVDFNTQDGGGSASKSTLIAAEGETLFDSIRNMIEISGQKLYWSHALSFIVSLDVAEDGLADLVDWIGRNPELRPESIIFVSREENARSVLSMETPNYVYHSYAMYSTARAMTNVSKAPLYQYHQVIGSLSDVGQAALLPVVGAVNVGDEKVLSVAGAAYLRDDKLSGFLTPEETFYWSFIVDEMKGGIINVQYGQNSDPNDTRRNRVALEVKKNKTKIKPEYKDSKLTIDVKFDTDVAVADVETKENIFTEDGQQKFVESAQKSMETKCMGLIQKMQSIGGPDIFGFGSAIKKSLPSLWKSIEKDWPNQFPVVKVHVESKINIQHFGETKAVIQTEADAS